MGGTKVGVKLSFQRPSHQTARQLDKSLSVLQEDDNSLVLEFQRSDYEQISGGKPSNEQELRGHFEGIMANADLDFGQKLRAVDTMVREAEQAGAGQQPLFRLQHQPGNQEYGEFTPPGFEQDENGATKSWKRRIILPGCGRLEKRSYACGLETYKAPVASWDDSSDPGVVTVALKFKTPQAGARAAARRL